MSKKTYPMNIQGLVKFLAEREGRLSQVSIGNLREIVGIFSDLIYNSEGIVGILYANGKRRSKRRCTRN